MSDLGTDLVSALASLDVDDLARHAVGLEQNKVPLDIFLACLLSTFLSSISWRFLRCEKIGSAEIRTQGC